MVEQQELDFRSVTISGGPGTGKNTLKNGLSDKLSPLGWRAFSGGDHMREYAIEKGYSVEEHGSAHHDASAYPPDFDRQVDFGMRERLQQEEHIILEAWLAGFFAQQIRGVLKVILYVPEVSVTVARLMFRDDLSEEKARNNIEKRLGTNLNRWQAMYQEQWQEWVVKPGLMSAEEPIDFWDPRIYDLAINTGKYNADQVLQIVLKRLGYQESLAEE